jgi:mono/diheme cytochrome c family protein
MRADRPRRGTAVRAAIVSGALLGVLAVAGCGTSEKETNLVRGKQLFVERCGACHVLQRAGTKGTQGPDLDAAFAQSIKDGMNRDTIKGVVEDQTLYPGEGSKMPAKLVTGKDAHDVAAYVGESAAKPGEDTGDLATAIAPADGGPGAQAFATTCGSCHTLEAAGTSGTIGPNLDELKPDVQRVMTAISTGPGEMPPNLLSGAEAQEVADFVAENAGK